MGIVALLSFYDEQPAMLAELTKSLVAAGVGGIVAVDGAYAEYPDAKVTTGSDQLAAILEVAGPAGMKIMTHVPKTPWAGNEIEKRTHLFALGHEMAVAGEDWFWVVDADIVVEDVGNLYETMVSTTADVLEVSWYEPGGANNTIRMLFRAQRSGIAIGKYHAHYVTGDGRSLWASCHRNLEEPAAFTTCRVRHRPNDRLGGVGGARNMAKRVYYERAVMLGIDEAVI